MVIVTCAIIIKENKILVTQRSDRMKLPLKWEFPGGKVEKGESLENCLLREINEELHINIRIDRKLSPNNHDYGGYTIQLNPFIASFISGDIILSEHTDFKWLTKSELLSIDWAPADIPIVHEFLSLDYDTGNL
jgi:8-oxo-dGTP diphosphatase